MARTASRIATIAIALIVVWVSEVFAQDIPPKPRLILQITVDQLRGER
jgi:hypothetical protein